MTNKDYLPKGDSQYSFWYDNFGNKLVGHGPTLGITNDEITAVQADALSVRTKLSEVQAIKQTMHSVVEAKNDTHSASRHAVRKLASRLKTHPDYTVSIGEELGIVPPDTPAFPGGLDNVKPDFEVVVLGDRVRLDWRKNIFDGVIIECKRGNETTWTRLEKDMRKNITPNVPETRIYRMRYILGDQEVGQWSDEAKAICGFEGAE